MVETHSSMGTMQSELTAALQPFKNDLRWLVLACLEDLLLDASRLSCPVRTSDISHLTANLTAHLMWLSS